MTDRPNLDPGRITPANMFSDNTDIKERLERDSGVGGKQSGVTGSRPIFPMVG